jgi:hypothetical protein
MPRRAMRGMTPRRRNACRHLGTLPVTQAPPACHAAAAAQLLGQHLPGDARLQDKDDPCQGDASRDDPWTPPLSLGGSGGKRGAMISHSLSLNSGVVKRDRRAGRRMGGAGLTLAGEHGGALYLANGASLEAVRSQAGASSPSGSSITNVVVTANAIYVTAGSALKAFRADTGAMLWRQDIPRLTTRHNLALAANDDEVFVGASLETLDAYGCKASGLASAVPAFHTDTGSLAWHFEDHNQTGAPAPGQTPGADSLPTPTGTSLGR